MYNIALAKGPIFDSGYIPYFYQSGKFLAYDIPNRSPASSYFPRLSGYDFTSDIVPKTNWPRQSTIEDIILKGYFAIPKSEPETALISDKNHTTKLGLHDVISQIKKRHEIYEDNMYQIELGKCYTISSQLAVESARGGVCMNSKEAYSLNKNLQELYQQQRDERVRLWQDVSKLKQILPEHAHSYLASYRKLAILEDLNGDTP
ncbi:MAG: hypothetical protein GY845_08615 [Planctomycetes bacterium]|nr:hypothetical protein [Planctomycetota bacterium]